MDLGRANMQGADLTGSNLDDAWAAAVNLDGANLRHADLRGTWLAHARLAHAPLTGALLDGVSLCGATGLETLRVEWIDISSTPISNDESDAPERLEGAEACSVL